MRKLLVVLFLFVGSYAQAQLEASSFDFFDGNEEPVQLKLTSDFKFLRKEKFNTAYQPAVLTVYGSQGDSLVYNIKIKARGNFRKKHCSFPPIKIKFDKDNFENSSLSEHNSLKLVTHCKSSPAYTDRLFEEYAIYKMYRLLTPYSLDARMLKINYVDTGSKNSPGEQFGFVIQEIEQVAEENNAREVSNKNVHMERLNRYLGTLMPTFEYMIGNTDWSVPALHNIKLLKDNDPEKYPLIPVPYDFDYCGLINAPYAVPPEKLELTSVRERRYRGYCRTKEEFQEVFDLFIEKKAQLLALIEDNPWIEKKTKLDDLKYLEEFFSNIENPKFIERSLMYECRQLDQ